VEPQRRHGRERVARLQEVAAQVFAEKGYDEATMAEIAERAGSPIGSLYRFFPSKEALADALIAQYAVRMDEAFTEIRERAGSVPLDETADALLHLSWNLKSEARALPAFLEARAVWPAKRMEFRNSALRQIAGIVRHLAPAIPEATASHMALILLQNMKTFSALKKQEPTEVADGAMEELRIMNWLYLEGRMKSAKVAR
jgi:AcrR family transcriptional regulator